MLHSVVWNGKKEILKSQQRSKAYPLIRLKRKGNYKFTLKDNSWGMIIWHQDGLHSHCHKQSCHHMKSEIAIAKKSYSESDCDIKIVSCK